MRLEKIEKEDMMALIGAVVFIFLALIKGIGWAVYRAALYFVAWTTAEWFKKRFEKWEETY